MINKKFNGHRLREGRVYRGVSITDLASQLGMSKQMISKYEKQGATPSFDTLEKITDILHFPREYFYEDHIEIKSGNTYFRSLLTTGKKDREMQYDRAKYITIIRSFLEEYVDFPVLDIPNVDNLKERNPEMIAQVVRNEWGLNDKPIKNIVNLLENKGFVLSSINLEKDIIDAFGTHQVIKEIEYYTIVLGNNKKSFYRRQFDVAHELGHKLLHDPYINMSTITKEEFRNMEKEANDFAAAFLLPKESFLRDVLLHPTDLNYYKILKKKWGVSISAMLMRAHKLGAVSDSSYNYMQRLISSKGWRKKEPFDDIKDINEPIAMKQAVELLIENEYVSVKNFLDRLSQEYGLSIGNEEIEELLGLDPGYLKVEEQKVTNNLISIKDMIDNKMPVK
ncbi:helix-turn-helix domain-containing protein [Macrococcoides canis]|uniref:helix-turn-helix domain-containing protein n=1 Tax=Macrococcoides canis TaxID=1855823 RepID=UPI0010FBF5B3|nr:XRE family transcriptional regulator [Macrococcus canis]QCT73733.1 ImmA/IrrE family metallo-endopeptidase [Macrococcus canis]QDB01326.1 ImmA/IrrE family metallo-endopeptidase [Macrococcus canis]UJS27835.1 XRE family transcriptional regulator [Macrococcus canis]UTH00131.1 XRE family transcriptional regulator [Macrococcus canis]